MGGSGSVERTNTEAKPQHLKPNHVISMSSSEGSVRATVEERILLKAGAVVAIRDGAIIAITVVGVATWAVSRLMNSNTMFSDFVKKILPQEDNESKQTVISSEATEKKVSGVTFRKELVEVRKLGIKIQGQFEELLNQNEKLEEEKKKSEHECFGQRESLRHLTMTLSDVSKQNHSLLVSNQMFHDLVEVYKGKEKELSRLYEEISTALKLRESEFKEKEHELNVVQAENQDLRGKYQLVLEDFAKVKDAEAGLGNTIGSLQEENGRLNRELWWVMRNAIPLMVSRLIWSDEFMREISKVEMLTMELGRQMGLQDGRDVLSPGTPNELLPGYDPSIQQRAGQAYAEFKHINWECVNELIKSPELSPSFLRRMLCLNGSSSSQ